MRKPPPRWPADSRGLIDPVAAVEQASTAGRERPPANPPPEPMTEHAPCAGAGAMDEVGTTDQRVAEIFRAVRKIFQRAGYQPGDPAVGGILQSMLAAHKFMRAQADADARPAQPTADRVIGFVAPATFASPPKSTLTVTQNDVDIANDICGALSDLPEALRAKLFNLIVARVAMARLK